MDTTLPKPFIFVLMPFDEQFDDIYKYGIKGAADDVGAYAERLDEQIFAEGMLDRIFNQIAKADVVVADMTGRNPNVFYEVGYAHALGKIVLLLTQRSEDIPFDLKHRQHTVYEGKIETLRSGLAPRLQWAIIESRKHGATGATERISVRIQGVDVPRVGNSTETPTFEGRVRERALALTLTVRNDSLETVHGISHVYLFGKPNAALVPYEYATLDHTALGQGMYTYTFGDTSYPRPLTSIDAADVDAVDGLTCQYRLPTKFGVLPPGAVEEDRLHVLFRSKDIETADCAFRLRIHTDRQFHDYAFRLSVTHVEPEASPAPKNGGE